MYICIYACVHTHRETHNIYTLIPKHVYLYVSLYIGVCVYI